jgi:hypothetical protein
MQSVTYKLFMLSVIMLNVIMLNVSMLNVIMLNVVMPKVVAPYLELTEGTSKKTYKINFLEKK